MCLADESEPADWIQRENGIISHAFQLNIHWTRMQWPMNLLNSNTNDAHLFLICTVDIPVYMKCMYVMKSCFFLIRKFSKQKINQFLKK